MGARGHMVYIFIVVLFDAYTVRGEEIIYHTVLIMYIHNQSFSIIIHNHMNIVSKVTRHIHICHATVSTQCLPHWFNHLYWNTPQYSNSNKRAPSQSSSECVYCSLSLIGLVIELQPHLPHLSSDNGFFCLLPLLFTIVILNKER